MIKAEHEESIRAQLGRAQRKVRGWLWLTLVLLIVGLGFLLTDRQKHAKLSPEAQRVVELVSWFQMKRGGVVEIAEGILTSRSDARAWLDLEREIFGGGVSTEERKARLRAVWAEAVRSINVAHSTDAGLILDAPSNAWLALRDERPPSISVSTLSGVSNRTIGLLGGRVTGDQIAFFREHVLEITNNNKEQILNLRLRFSFPERVVPESVYTQPVAQVRFEREELQTVAFASPGGSIQRTGPANPPYRTAIITVDFIAPFSTVVLGFLTIPPDRFDYLERIHPSECVYDYVKGVYLRDGRLEGVFRHFELDSERKLV
ncbi:MAG: hypothetical protein ABTQ32_38885, partial [Myxococcaceae bacterium]